MDAYLVRPSRIDFDVEQREFSIGRFDPALNLIVRDCIAPPELRVVIRLRRTLSRRIGESMVAGLFLAIREQRLVIFFHFPASEL